MKSRGRPKEMGHCWNDGCLWYGLPKIVKMNSEEQWLCGECGGPMYTKVPPNSINIYCPDDRETSLL